MFKKLPENDVNLTFLANYILKLLFLYFNMGFYWQQTNDNFSGQLPIGMQYVQMFASACGLSTAD